MTESQAPEPWLRGTHSDLPAVVRGVVHALELAQEDAQRWCGSLTAAEVDARVAGLPSVAFQLRHIAGSIDRLLTYAEGRGLHAEQLGALREEADAGATTDVLLAEYATALSRASERVIAFRRANLEEARTVGRRQLPSTLGGLLVHIADHTQRHSGQMVTTVKFIVALRNGATSPGSR